MIAFILKGIDDVHARFATRGTEALSLLERESFDALVLDLELPDFSGLEVLRQVRKSKNPEVNQIPCVVVTARVLPSDRKQALEAGANYFVPKPVDTRHLRILLKRLTTAKSSRQAVGKITAHD